MKRSIAFLICLAIFFLRLHLATAKEASHQTSQWDPADFTYVYDVGPGRAYRDPNEIPWESLAPDSLVRIYWRSEPYRTKWVINTEALADAPVVIQGIPDEQGRLPVISGENATTRQELNYWNEDRSIIKIGGSNLPSANLVPAFIYIENLDIQNARSEYTFTDHEGKRQNYRSNAATIHIEVGSSITIRGCVLHRAGNGLFASWQGSNIFIYGNYIFDNGVKDSVYEHNSYTETQGITFEFNHYGPLCSGCLGNNLKDRSSGTVVRYNWIEGGNRQLDLVESEHPEIFNDPTYRKTYVYGNILIEPTADGNSQIVHYGGDGNVASLYRNGTLYFYHNTVIWNRSGNNTLLKLSNVFQAADVRSNILHVQNDSGNLAIKSGKGSVLLRGNWLQAGWQDSFDLLLKSRVNNLGNEEGKEPGFVDPNSADFHLNPQSICINHAAPLAPSATLYPVTQQYVKHQQGESRNDAGIPDIGAFAYISTID